MGGSDCREEPCDEQVLVMAPHHAHSDRGAAYESERHRIYLKRRGPFWRRDTGVDSTHPAIIATFIASGVLGWGLLGTVLIFAPGTWVEGALGVSFMLVALQYWAWWRLGSSWALISPLPIRQMSRVLGLPEASAVVVVYGTMSWVLISLIIRWIKGGVPGAAHHPLVPFVALAGLIAFWALLAASAILHFLDNFHFRTLRTSGPENHGRMMIAQRVLGRFVPTAYRLCLVSATILVYALTTIWLA